MCYCLSNARGGFQPFSNFPQTLLDLPDENFVWQPPPFFFAIFLEIWEKIKSLEQISGKESPGESR